MKKLFEGTFRTVLSITLAATLFAGGIAVVPQKVEAARSVSFLQFTGDATALSVHTFASQNLGTAAADRYIFVIVHGEEKATPITSVTVTVGGVTATTDVFVDDAGNGDIAAIARARVPTGTTGDIVVTTNDLTGIGIGVYRASGIGTPVLKQTTTDQDDIINLSINTSVGGLVLAGASFQSDGFSVTTSGVTENYDSDIGVGTDRSVGGFSFPTTGEVGKAISFDSADSGNAAGVAASYAASAALTKPANNLGLVGYWPFNEGTSTQAGDFSGNGHTGTLSGNAINWTSGRRGGALDFGGTDDNVSLDSLSALNGAQKVTISAWIYDTSGAASKSIISRYSSSPADPSFSFFTSDPAAGGGDDIEFDADGTEGIFTIGNVHKTNRWEHWVVVFDGTLGTDLSSNSVLLYLNGVSQTKDITSAPYPTAIDTSAQNVRIGADSDQAGDFTGKIDDVRIYNRALSASEVAALYAGGSTGAARGNASSKTLTNGTKLGPANGLVGLWTFDGGDVRWTSPTAGVAYDGSGQDNIGTLTNMSRITSVAIGKLGQALHFDGIASTVSTKDMDSTDGVSTLSVALWLKADSLAVSQVLVSKYNGTSGWVLTTSGGCGGSDDIDFYAAASVANSYGCSTSNAHQAGAWEHWIVVFDGTQSGNSNRLKFYENGVLQSSSYGAGGVPATTDSNTAIVTMGQHPSGTPDAYYPGAMDDVRVYNRALTAAEVMQLYRLGTATVKP